MMMMMMMMTTMKMLGVLPLHTSARARAAAVDAADF